MGVDQMLYMKSSSGNDGSYNLTVSFALGTDPEHRHRQRQQPRADGAVAAARRGAAAGPDGAEALVRRAAVHDVLQRQRPAGPAVHHQLRHHQRARRAVAHAGRRPGLAVRQAQIFDADLVRRPAPEQPRHGALRDHQRDPVAERPGAGRPHRRAADRRRPAVPVQPADQGPPDHAGGVRRHRRARQPGRLGAAGEGRRPRRDGGAELGQLQPPRRQARGRDRHLSGAGRQRGADRRRRQRDPGQGRQALPRGAEVQGRLRFDDLRERHDPRGAEDASARPSSSW